jgi:hypothetical protein
VDHSWDTAGEYTVQLRITDSDGLTDTLDQPLSLKVFKTWALTWGGSGSCWSSDLALDNSGGVYATGGLDGDIDFDPGPGTTQLASTGAWLSKFDLDGGFSWVKNWGPPPGTYTWDAQGFACNAVAADNNGIYLCGTEIGYADLDPGSAVSLVVPDVGEGHDADLDGYWLSGLDTSGNFKWADNRAGYHRSVAWGQWWSERFWGREVALDSLGNVLMADGSYDGGLTLVSVSWDYYYANLGSYTSSGALNASYQWGGGSSCDPHGIYTYSSAGDAFAVAISKSSYYYMLGTSQYKGDPLGDVLGCVWILDDLTKDPLSRTSWGAGNDGLTVKAIAVDSNGNAYAGGNFKGTANLGVDASPMTHISNGDFDCYLDKISSDGTIQWAFSLGGPGADALIDIATDESDNIIVLGRYSGTADFDPGSGTQLLTATGPADAFIAKFDTAGNLVWVKDIGGTGTTFPRGIKCDDDGLLYVAGDFTGSVDMDPSADEDIKTATGVRDSFLVRLLPNGNK